MLKEYVHRFRNALVKASELESHRLCTLGRWNELNSFPFGSCDIASNFLAMYLKEKGFESKIIWCKNELEQYSSVKSHVWLEVDDTFIDITISQFNEYNNNRIHISKKNSPTMLMEIYKDCKKLGHHNYQEREIQLSSASESGHCLYEEIKKLADAA
ncbi:hypothetical protein [Amphritea pacifica]|uniref:Microcin J25-processing protein McjB C-terminal domain-containing protein n=1 Tax=Amphritea pacifica TaxID=2811233 RepID=A0ABS2W3F0_9GAMM|nr:hypothetical protein [Amphritea pacifica]MBN0986228.1 hypothetical protein [Amphritea pacifica]